jgi:pyruvyltransferase
MLSRQLINLRRTCLWRVFKRFGADPIRRWSANVSCQGSLPLFWFPESNWGDALNPVLVGLLSGKTVRRTQASHCDRYMAIGSILGNANSRAVVWGSGFIKEGDMVQEPPKAIHAVRGPLTRSALLKAGIDCPEVYGDPALLLPLFFNPEVIKEFEIGIVPHYVDKAHPWIDKQRNVSGVLVIDVEGDTWEFVRAVKSCKTIISSSLHGLICADAYGVPNACMHLSDGVVGGDFKFRDYWMSIGADKAQPIVVTEQTRLEEVVASADFHQLHIDLSKLLLACPFISESIGKQMLSHMQSSQFSDTSIALVR